MGPSAALASSVERSTSISDSIATEAIVTMRRRPKRST
jgi:hypothetical protein